MSNYGWGVLETTFTANSPAVSNWFCWLVLYLALAFSTAAGRPLPKAVGPSGGSCISNAGEHKGGLLKQELGNGSLCKSQATTWGCASDILESFMSEPNSK